MESGEHTKKYMKKIYKNDIVPKIVMGLKELGE